MANLSLDQPGIRADTYRPPARGTPRTRVRRNVPALHPLPASGRIDCTSRHSEERRMKPLVAAVAVLVALATVAPKLMRLRIRFFKWLHWTWAARVTEEHFERWVLVLRIVLLVLAVALLFFGVATKW